MRTAYHNYKINYTFDDELNVVQEVGAYVCDGRSFAWQEIYPDHRYNTDYESNKKGHAWYHKGYFDRVNK